MATKKQNQDAMQQNMVEAASKTEQFLDKNKNIIIGALTALLVIALSILCYTRFYLQPRKAKAASELFHAEQAFAEGNYKEALEGNDDYAGFEEIARRYGKKAGKSVYLYEGISALNEGEYEAAIKALKKYTGKDAILAARALGCIGDAYVGLEEYDTAASWYAKAAAKADNVFAATYLLKEGICLEKTEQPEKAVECYKVIKDKYPQSVEGMDIDKYITRIEFAK